MARHRTARDTAESCRDRSASRRLRVNRFVRADSHDLSFLPDDAVTLVVTSPPYNVRKSYTAVNQR